MSPVLVYTTPFCPGCKITKAKFDGSGVAYESIDLTTLPDAEVEALKASVGLQAPLVVVPDDAAYGDLAGSSWSGVNPAGINALAQRAA